MDITKITGILLPGKLTIDLSGLNKNTRITSSGTVRSHSEEASAGAGAPSVHWQPFFVTHVVLARSSFPSCWTKAWTPHDLSSGASHFYTECRTACFMRATACMGRERGEEERAEYWRRCGRAELTA